MRALAPTLAILITGCSSTPSALANHLPIPPPPATVTPTAAPAPPVASALPVASVAPTPLAAPPSDPLQIELDAIVKRAGAPLLSDDGNWIAQTSSGVFDDARGPWTALDLTDVSGKIKPRSILLLSNSDAPAKSAQLAAMRAALDERAWTPLIAYEMTDDSTVEPRYHGLGMSRPMAGQGEGLIVKFHEPTLIVSDGKGREILRSSYPAWSPQITRFGQYCSMLTDLSGAWGSRSRGVLWLTLHSSGSPDFCQSIDVTRAVRIALKPR